LVLIKAKQESGAVLVVANCPKSSRTFPKRPNRHHKAVAGFESIPNTQGGRALSATHSLSPKVVIPIADTICRPLDKWKTIEAS